MQDAVEADLDAGEPSRHKAAHADGDTTGENPPEAADNSGHAGGRRGPCIGIDGPQTHSCTEQAEQKLKDDGENDAAEYRRP